MTGSGSFITLLFVAIALGAAAWITLAFLWNLRRDKTPFGRKLWRYIRDVLDALWGAG